VGSVRMARMSYHHLPNGRNPSSEG